ncbi:MAG TPA: DNA polymerase/3'-5' exonuclease PolX, partial [Vicinamibacteria bacterium]
LAELYATGGEKAVETVPGVGKSIAEKIVEFLSKGKVPYLEAMRTKHPVDVFALTSIEGVGPKTVAALYDALGVRSLPDLEKAAREGRIRKLKGFGEKTEHQILQGLEFLSRARGRFLLGDVLPLASQIESRLGRVRGVPKVEVAGSIRRRKETIGDADIVAVSGDPERVMEAFVSMPEVAHVYGRGPTKSNVRLENGLDVDLRVVPAESYGAAMCYFTGSKAHNVHLRRIALSKGYKLNEYGLYDVSGGKERVIGGRTEEEIYKALGLDYVPPELREDRGEVEAALEGKLPRLVPYGKLKGDLQVQTNWTDGKHSIEEMAEAARSRGLEYIAITDHAIELAMTGLDAKRLLEQRKEIQKINRHNPGIEILSGVEVNILKDGTLDIEDEVLSKLDVVGAAVHTHLHLSKTEMTARICRALRNPHVDILFHPTGRILMKRDPYEVDIDEVIRVARETGTLLEVDSIFDRLDLKDEHVRAAVEAGVKLVVDSDAHATKHFDSLPLGVATARRGWATAADVVNTRPLPRFLRALKDRGRKRVQ